MEPDKAFDEDQSNTVFVTKGRKPGEFAPALLVE
jgi:hypothetical protein